MRPERRCRSRNVGAQHQTDAKRKYDFEMNAWHKLDASSHPMLPHDAENWLKGWNEVDYLAARRLLLG
jgi:hypothetical protein